MASLEDGDLPAIAVPMKDPGVRDSVPELSRALRPRHITIGGIIGAGLFVGSSVAIAATGPLVILSYALTGLLFLIVMRCLGEMAVARPDIRSFTEFARAGFGNWAGFTGEFEFWFASIKVAAIIVFMAVCGGFIFGEMGSHQSVWQVWSAHGGPLPKGYGVIVTAVATIFFSMMGAEIAAIAAVESPAVAAIALDKDVSSQFWASAGSIAVTLAAYLLRRRQSLILDNS